MTQPFCIKTAETVQTLFHVEVMPSAIVEFPCQLTHDWQQASGFTTLGLEVWKMCMGRVRVANHAEVHICQPVCHRINSVHVLDFLEDVSQMLQRRHLLSSRPSGPQSCVNEAAIHMRENSL